VRNIIFDKKVYFRLFYQVGAKLRRKKTTRGKEIFFGGLLGGI
jgi:hypothetical protein